MQQRARVWGCVDLPTFSGQMVGGAGAQELLHLRQELARRVVVHVMAGICNTHGTYVRIAATHGFDGARLAEIRAGAGKKEGRHAQALNNWPPVDLWGGTR